MVEVRIDNNPESTTRILIGILSKLNKVMSVHRNKTVRIAKKNPGVFKIKTD